MSRILSSAVTFLAAILLCGHSLARAEEPAAAEYRLDLVPADGFAVFGVRPAALLAAEPIQPLKPLLEEDGYLRPLFGLDVTELEQALVVLSFAGEAGRSPVQMAFVFRSRQPLDHASVQAALFEQTRTVTHKGRTFLQDSVTKYPVRTCWFVDDRTFVIAEGEGRMESVIDASLAKNHPEWTTAVVPQATVFAYQNVATLRPVWQMMIDQMAAFNRGRGIPKSEVAVGLVAPLWQGTDAMVWNMSLAQEFQLKGAVFATGPETAGDVADTLAAVVTLSRNSVRYLESRLRKEAGNVPATLAVAVPLLQIAEDLLTEFEFRRDGRRVLVTTAWDTKQTAELTAKLVPAFREIRMINRRNRSKNNLKQIGLAMHNYHDTHRHLPAPSVLGPDGKTRHSWRVAILPFLEQENLYNQYHFDEPWDSEHNKTLLDQMPDIYRHPLDEADSTHASYFAFVGEKTALGKKEGDGNSIRNITDGTSNTLMVAAAKKKVPWTKPEDIDYDPNAQKPPKFEGWTEDGTYVLFCDGSVHFLLKSIELDSLKRLIECNDGQVINREEGLRPQ